MDKVEMTAWLAEHRLGCKRGTIEHVPTWATNRDLTREYCDYSHDGNVRIKFCKEEMCRMWDPLDDLSDAWLLVEEMVRNGGSPNLVFDDNLIEDEGAWCCTCDGWNDIPDPDAEDVPSLNFSAICKYWYATPELAICACAALAEGKILVQEEENRFELYDEPPIELTPEMKAFMERIIGEDDDGTSEEGTPGTDG